MKRLHLPAVVAVALATTFLTGCSAPSPAEAGEEYGSTIKHGDAQVKCIVQSLKEYEDERDTDAFVEACKERAER
ncbi:hypothetical protein OHU11_30025 [Streptomyces sp. NBC_00257]|uniref:hypothetical protein n=1 Tax=unclassified Streptomyces TaxID=2593676 RepID=UPI00224D509E|nr:MULTISPECIES: hypothetical protein [unclassified Streptomyces]MCX5431890.1 hypothetical protein [Streptomyces sp. NBC_00062]